MTKILMGLVPEESQIKPGLSKKKMIHVMFWRLSQEKVNTKMLGYLTRGAHITCTQKESGSVLTSLMMETLSWWEMMLCATAGIYNIHMRTFDGQIWTIMNIWHVTNLKKIFSRCELWKLKGTSFLVQIEKSKLLKAPWRFSKENGQQTCTTW